MNIIYSFIDSAFSLAAKIKTFCKPLLSASYLKATSRNYFYSKSIKMHLVVIRNQRISRYDTFSEFSNMQFAIQLEVKFEDVDCEIFRLNIPNKTRLRNFLFAVCFRLNRLRFSQLYFGTWSLFSFLLRQAFNQTWSHSIPNTSRFFCDFICVFMWYTTKIPFLYGVISKMAFHWKS